MSELNIDWDINDTTQVLQPVDFSIDPAIEDDGEHWLMCCLCNQDLVAGETVCKFPQMDGQVVLTWQLVHPLCVAKLMIDEAAVQLEESVRI